MDRRINKNDQVFFMRKNKIWNGTVKDFFLNELTFVEFKDNGTKNAFMKNSKLFLSMHSLIEYLKSENVLINIQNQ